MSRRGLSQAEQDQVWEWRREGATLSKIVRRLGRRDGAVQALVAATGGIRPRARRRSKWQLTAAEREEISRGLAAGESCRQVARQLGRAPSSISREVARNGGRASYRAAGAEAAAMARGRRPKAGKLRLSAPLRQAVEELLQLRWSPRQISRRLKMDYPFEPTMNASPETIYLSLYVQGRGELRKELTRYLRQRRSLRHAQTEKVVGRGQIPDRVMISQRPAEVEDRAVPGHWEGDLLRGTPTSAIGTLVERSTRYLLLFKVPSKVTAEGVRQVLTETILRFPESLRRSLTWDQGKEMSQHVRFTVDTGVQVYFCDPMSPWQRGSNENTNGLLRDYYPKGKSLRNVTQEELDHVADELNGRPRETLGFYKPKEVMARLLENVSQAGGATTA